MKGTQTSGGVDSLCQSFLSSPNPKCILNKPRNLLLSHSLIHFSVSCYSKSQVIKSPLKSLSTSSSTCLSLMAGGDPRVPMEVDENGAAVEGKGAMDGWCTTELIIVRHGETDWNAIGKMQGHLDVDLNEVGRQQAAAVAERLSKEPNVSVVYSSDLKRARDTAEKIATRCGGLEVICDQGLRERHLGDLQGAVYHELAKVKPEAYQALRSPRMDQEIPGGGESRDQLYKRCTSTVQRIGEKHRGQRVVVVTHGGVIRSLYNRADHKVQPAGKILNTSVSVLQLSDANVWSIKSWNDVSHLREAEFLESAFGGDASSG